MPFYKCMSSEVGEAEELDRFGWSSGNEPSAEDAIMKYLDACPEDIPSRGHGVVFCQEQPKGVIKSYNYEVEYNPVYSVSGGEVVVDDNW